MKRMKTILCIILFLFILHNYVVLPLRDYSGPCRNVYLTLDQQDLRLRDPNFTMFFNLDF